MKKYIIPLMVVLIMLAGCQAQNKEVNNKEVTESEKMFNLMVDAKKEQRELTKDEAESLQDFYMYKPLKDRGDNLDHALSQMFFNFYNDDVFDKFKGEAEKYMKEI